MPERCSGAAGRPESGCHTYEAVVDVSAPAGSFAAFGADTFVVVERWEPMEALRAHAVAPHMKVYASRVKELTQKAPETKGIR